MLTLDINGKKFETDAEPDTPLLWVLRDHLGLTGSKYGCGKALCGACTVHVDGAATRSCITTVDSVGDSAVTTIEGFVPSSAAGEISSTAFSCFGSLVALVLAVVDCAIAACVQIIANAEMPTRPTRVFIEIPSLRLRSNGA